MVWKQYADIAERVIDQTCIVSSVARRAAARDAAER
jgi:hypothetical protein